MPKYRVKRHSVTQPLDESYRLIPLTQGQNAIVDLADFEWLSGFNWCAHWHEETGTFYARKAGRGGEIKMHRIIMSAQKGEYVDHEDHNTLNNRRYNLRKCTNAENSRNHRKHSNNTSGHNGVRWNPRGHNWEAFIVVDRDHKFLGYFKQKQDAVKAREQAEDRFYGEFAFHCPLIETGT